MSDTSVSGPTGLSPKLLLLHGDDTVYVTVDEVTRGEALALGEQTVVAASDIGMGHKLARRTLRAGEAVIKYGAHVGSMTAPAAAGEHVHLHNMKSDYIPSHTRHRESSE